MICFELSFEVYSLSLSTVDISGSSSIEFPVYPVLSSIVTCSCLTSIESPFSLSLLEEVGTFEDVSLPFRSMVRDLGTVEEFEESWFEEALACRPEEPILSIS